MAEEVPVEQLEVEAQVESDVAESKNLAAKQRAEQKQGEKAETKSEEAETKSEKAEANDEKAEFAESGEDEQASEQVAEEKPFECDPVISLKVQSKKRSQILKDLAEKHEFSLKFASSSDSAITLEQTRKLSGVLKSVTRGLNVVSRFETVGTCRKLIELSILKKEASGSAEVISYDAPASSSNTSSSSGNRESKRESKREAREARKNKKTRDQDGSGMSREERKAQKRAEREEKKANRSSSGGKKNKTPRMKMNVSSSNEDAEPIHDMEQYVREVMSGERKLDKRSMSREQRMEYKKVKKAMRDNGG